MAIYESAYAGADENYARKLHADMVHLAEVAAVAHELDLDPLDPEHLSWIMEILDFRRRLNAGLDAFRTRWSVEVGVTLARWGGVPDGPVASPEALAVRSWDEVRTAAGILAITAA